MNLWSVYLVRCGDDTLYTGIATDVARRLSEHESGAGGAKYLRGRGPLELVYEQLIGSRSLASKVEYRIKKLPRRRKQDPRVLSGLIADVLDESAAAEISGERPLIDGDSLAER